LNFDYFIDQPFKTQNQLQNDQISPSNSSPRRHKNIFVYAPPRCFSAENSGSGGDGFPHSEEKNGNKNWSFPHNREELRRVRGLYGQTVQKCVYGIPPL